MTNPHTKLLPKANRTTQTYGDKVGRQFARMTTTVTQDCLLMIIILLVITHVAVRVSDFIHHDARTSYQSTSSNH